MTRTLFSIVVLSCYAWFAGPYSAQAQDLVNTANGAKYLAFGDSLAFGFSPFVDSLDPDKSVAYPQIIANLLHLDLANASCPGETSRSFIDTIGPLPGFSCGPNANATVFKLNGPATVAIPLLLPYNGAASQLNYAVNYLENNPHPKLVTITIGGNDLAPLLTCTSQCDVLAGTLLRDLAQNLGMILAAIRGTGYQGTIVVTNYYAFNYNDPLEVGVTGAFTLLNATIGSVATLPQFGAKVGDVFKVFQIASGSAGDPCKAGLLLKVPDSTACDTHPSLLGQTLIATAVALSN